MKLNFINRFFKNTQISNFIEFHPVGAEVPYGKRTDGQTGMTKLTVAFCKHAEECSSFKRTLVQVL